MIDSFDRYMVQGNLIQDLIYLTEIFPCPSLLVDVMSCHTVRADVLLFKRYTVVSWIFCQSCWISAVTWRSTSEQRTGDAGSFNRCCLGTDPFTILPLKAESAGLLKCDITSASSKWGPWRKSKPWPDILLQIKSVIQPNTIQWKCVINGRQKQWAT